MQMPTGVPAMELVLPLEKMTTDDKLRAMEQIWADLQNSGDEIAPPAWHGDVLRAREARIAAGESKFSDWAEAKERIRKNTR